MIKKTLFKFWEFKDLVEWPQDKDSAFCCWRVEGWGGGENKNLIKLENVTHFAAGDNFIIILETPGSSQTDHNWYQGEEKRSREGLGRTMKDKGPGGVNGRCFNLLFKFYSEFVSFKDKNILHLPRNFPGIWIILVTCRLDVIRKYCVTTDVILDYINCVAKMRWDAVSVLEVEGRRKASMSIPIFSLVGK